MEGFWYFRSFLVLRGGFIRGGKFGGGGCLEILD